jgi:hypothetical protein
MGSLSEDDEKRCILNIWKHAKCFLIQRPQTSSRTEQSRVLRLTMREWYVKWLTDTCCNGWPSRHRHAAYRNIGTWEIWLRISKFRCWSWQLLNYICTCTDRKEEVGCVRGYWVLGLSTVRHSKEHNFWESGPASVLWTLSQWLRLQPTEQVPFTLSPDRHRYSFRNVVFCRIPGGR